MVSIPIYTYQLERWVTYIFCVKYGEQYNQNFPSWSIFSSKFKIELFFISDTPSYLSASVAAFGYSKYYSASKSIHNLVHTETSPLVIQHAVGHKLSIARSHSGTSDIKNEVVTSAISSTVTNTFGEKKSRVVGNMCGDAGSILEDSKSSCRRTEVFLLVLH